MHVTKTSTITLTLTENELLWLRNAVFRDQQANKDSSRDNQHEFLTQFMERTTGLR